MSTTRKTGCDGKKRYATAGDAIAAAVRRVRKTVAYRPYECAHCQGWHLTTRTRFKKLSDFVVE